jgi:uncharacterized membrane protein (DUF2068 family)
MDARQNQMISRGLAALHGIFALVALGIGNATLESPGDHPALAHLAFGIVLAVAAYALWRRSAWTRWTIALNGAASLIVALTLLASWASRGDAVPAALVLAAVAFAAIELFTFRHATGFVGARSSKPDGL